MDEDVTGRLVKQVIVIRRDLGMRRGKEIAQGAHAAMAWLTRRFLEWPAPYQSDRAVVAGHSYGKFVTLSNAERAWITGSFRKVTCQVRSAGELLAVHQAALDAGLQSHLITDQGLTEFHGEPTPTAIGIGPDYDDLINPVTGELELY